MSTLAWITDSEHRDHFVATLNSQRKGGEFCDVLLKVSGQTLPTHACVLSACSPVFKELIYADRPNAPHLITTNAPQEIDLVMPGVSGGLPTREGDGLDVMADLLEYIYTGNITLKEDSLELVIKLAEAFALEGLCALIKTHVSGVPDLANDKPEMAGSDRTSVIPARSKGKRRKMPPKRKTTPVKTARRGRPTRSVPAPLPAPAVPDPDARVLRSRERRGAAILACRTWRRVSEDEHGSSSSGEDEMVPVGDGGVVTVKATEVPAVGSVRRKRRAAGTSGKPGYSYTCRQPQCTFTSGNVRAVRAHKEIHPGRSYKCASCEFFTGHCAKMLVHLRQVNHMETECCLCGEVAVDRPAFLEHLTRHDDPRLPFFCRMCDYRCRTRSHLTDHEAKHAIERPFKCDECTRGFKWKTSLQTHKLSHQKTKMHLCDQCGYSTAYLNNLRVHERKHNGGMMPCAYCQYQSNCKHQLKKHELTHAEPKLKPYVCEKCGQKYAHCHALRRHVRTHDPAAHNLRCGLCEFVTVRRDKLRDHGKKFHDGLVIEAGGEHCVYVAPLPITAPPAKTERNPATTHGKNTDEDVRGKVLASVAPMPMSDDPHEHFPVGSQFQVESGDQIIIVPDGQFMIDAGGLLVTQMT